MEEKGLFEERGYMQIGRKTSTSGICISRRDEERHWRNWPHLGAKTAQDLEQLVVKGTGPVAGRPTNALDAAWLDLNEKKKSGTR